MKVFPHPPRRSPFKRKLLRSPGQSVQREMDRLLEDRALPIIVFASVMGVMAIYDWAVILLHYTPRPYFSTTLALLGAGYATYKYFDFKRTIERLRLGRDGERIVGRPTIYGHPQAAARPKDRTRPFVPVLRSPIPSPRSQWREP
jgi:hypothetical protein